MSNNFTLIIIDGEWTHKESLFIFRQSCQEHVYKIITIYYKNN